MSPIDIGRGICREEQGRRADRLWLETFPDAPGAWIKAAVAAERARRAEAGLAQPEPVDRW